MILEPRLVVEVALEHPAWIVEACHHQKEVLIPGVYGGCRNLEASNSKTMCAYTCK